MSNPSVERSEYPALISTGIDTAGNFDAGLGTTIHLFQYDYLAGGWAYRRTFEVAGNSVAYDQGTEAVEEGPWRTLSSDARLIVVQELGASTLHNKSFDNRGTYMPTAETGYCTAQGSGVFYGLVEPAISDGDAGKVALGNLGATEATVNIERYVPDNTIALAPMPSELNGTSGRWVLAAAGVRIPPGLAAAGNARIFSSLDGPAFSGPSTSIFRVRLQAGGPIQVLAGAGLFSAFSGGSVMHAIDGKPAGAEFWFHQGQSTVADNWECGNGPGFTDTQTINVYCPKTGMAVRCQSGDGYSATYTTGGPDQCISFTALTDPASGARRNYRLSVLGGGTPGNVIAQFIQCVFTEKGYTAPFLQSGVYYTIIMPPVVYSGQYFWITVVVQDVGGGTKTDYGGITSFSGTDPLSRIENQPMDSYNYDWTSGVENGVKVFVRVQLFALGQQSVVAIDTEDGSISGIASTMVVGADVKLSKEPRLAVMSSGEQVQFRICWSNYSTATAEAFTITDAVPMGTSYVPEAASLMVCGTGGPAAPTVTVSYGGASATTPATFNTLTSPTQTAPASTRWLRWTVRDVYVGSTGCVCFRARVD